MKKIMIAAAVVCAAVAVQAASFSWQLQTGKVYAGSGDKTLLGSGTAYIIDAGVYSQQALLDAAGKEGFDLSKFSVNAASKGTVTDGLVSGNAGFTYDVTESFNAYYAILSGDKLFISDVVASGFQESATQDIKFSTSPAKTSNNLAIEGGKYGAANSWYSVVPEPTSGLMLLLGVAGLALRRRRA